MKQILALWLLLGCLTATAGEIHKACLNGDLDAAKKIVEANPAAVSEVDASGRTPLMFAARTNKTLVEFLIAKKADVNAKSKYNDTALHMATMRGMADIVEILLKNGADVNARNDNGENAAYLVVRSRRDAAGKTILETLIRYKVDLNTRNKDGFTVLDGARGTTGTELFAIVKRAGGRGGNFRD